MSVVADKDGMHAETYIFHEQNPHFITSVKYYYTEKELKFIKNKPLIKKRVKIKKEVKT